MRNWPTRLIPMSTGYDVSGSTVDPEIGDMLSLNLDYSVKNAVRGRYGLQKREIFTARLLNTATSYTWQTNGTTFGAQGFTANGMFTVKDDQGERPAINCNGRIFVGERTSAASTGLNWHDRLGAGAMTVRRLPTFRNHLDPHSLPPGGWNRTTLLNVAPTGYTSGPAQPINELAFLDTSQGSLLNGDDGLEIIDAPSLIKRGPGTTATYFNGQNVPKDWHVSVEPGTNNLRVVSGDGSTATLLAADASFPTGFGDNPVATCDYDQTTVYVAYWSNVAGNHVKVLSFSATTGNIITGATDAFIGGGAGTRGGIWLTSTNIATNRLVLCVQFSTIAGVLARTLNATTFANIGVDSTLGALAGGGPIVCGVAENDLCWVASVHNDGTLAVYTKQISTATFNFIMAYTGVWYSGRGSSQAVSWFIAHQPIKVSGRILIGIDQVPWWTVGTTNNYGAQACTWYELDFTNTNQLTYYGTLQPTIVAMGPFNGSAQHWNPVTAKVNFDGLKFRFSSIDWKQFRAGTANVADVIGFNGEQALNELAWTNPQCVNFGNTTILSGSVPHSAAKGVFTEHGWVEQPKITGAAGAGGGLAAGSYGVQVVWEYTDEAGQVYRSLPSPNFVFTAILNDKITITIQPPQLTEKLLDKIVAKVYATDNTVGSLKRLQNLVQGGVTRGDYINLSAGAQTVDVGVIGITTGTELLYTEGGVLSNEPLNASGGITTVGERVYASDGRYVFASKLSRFGDALEFHTDEDDPLAIKIPADIGLIKALSWLDNRVIVLGSKGVYFTGGEGPDDKGVGQQFATPVRVADFGIDRAHAVISTPRGVFFQANTFFNSNDVIKENIAGGLWLYDRGGNLSQIGDKIRYTINTTSYIVSDMKYLPNSEILVIQLDQGGSQSPALALNLRNGKWSQWYFTVSSDQPYWLTAANGVLYYMSPGVPFSQDYKRGYDSNASEQNFNMSVTLGPISLQAADLLQWSRFKSLKVLGEPATVSHTLTMQAIPDEVGTAMTNGGVTIPVAVGGATWPRDRYAPEWRLPSQKASELEVTITASPGVATWTALEVQAKPISRAPSGRRS